MQVICPLCKSPTQHCVCTSVPMSPSPMPQVEQPIKVNDCWQLCPKCLGEKTTYICRICKDEGIISRLTGRPPSKA